MSFEPGRRPFSYHSVFEIVYTLILFTTVPLYVTTRVYVDDTSACVTVTPFTHSLFTTGAVLAKRMYSSFYIWNIVCEREPINRNFGTSRFLLYVTSYVVSVA